MDKSVLSILQARVKAVHTELRAGGAPYWTHPLRCHEQLMRCWGGAPLEVQIAILFHDTLEDIEGGEYAIQSALNDIRDTCPSLDDEKVFALVRDVTTPQDVTKEQAIEQIKQRFSEGRVNAESYLLKAVDIRDNTTDILDCYEKYPEDKDIQRHLSSNKLQKYTGYINAVRCGLNGNQKFREIYTVELHTAMSLTIGDVRANLNEIAALLGEDQPVFPKHRKPLINSSLRGRK